MDPVQFDYADYRVVDGVQVPFQRGCLRSPEVDGAYGSRKFDRMSHRREQICQAAAESFSQRFHRAKLIDKAQRFLGC